MKIEPAAFSVHSIRDGSAVGEVETPLSFSWGRQLSEVSQCKISAPLQDISTQLIPWVHWVSCWHGQSLEWFGPILEVDRTRTGMSIDARDVSILMAHTRTQVTQSWDQLNVAPIARDMWRHMLDFQGIDAEPVVLPALATAATYNVAVTADHRYVSQDMADLVKLGLLWTVVRGRPVLGTQPAAPVAELEDSHFSADASIHRSGAKTANDVRIQGKNSAYTARAPLAGLRLQSIVNLDNLFGVANIQRAAEEYLSRTAVIRDEVVLPSNATLTLDAPVELSDLVPGATLSVSALGVRTILRLDQMQVSGSSSGTSVSVSMSYQQTPTELEHSGGAVQSG